MTIPAVLDIHTSIRSSQETEDSVQQSIRCRRTPVSRRPAVVGSKIRAERDKRGSRDGSWRQSRPPTQHKTHNHSDQACGTVETVAQQAHRSAHEQILNARTPTRMSLIARVERILDCSQGEASLNPTKATIPSTQSIRKRRTSPRRDASRPGNRNSTSRKVRFVSEKKRSATIWKQTSRTRHQRS